ncbi:MAG TPA: ATP-binding protein [Methylococcaceae bacterium]|nr:ATP-binding protein [Methylococcaceae bacterium]
MNPEPSVLSSLSAPLFSEDGSPAFRPCPFSRNYRISARLAWQSLLVFLIFRLGLAGALLFAFSTRTANSFLGKLAPGLFGRASLVYFALVLIGFLLWILRRPAYPFQAQLHIFTDIVALTLLAHLSGGVQSGLGILLTVTVAAGGILVGGRCALVFAALASIGFLGEQFYSDLTDAFPPANYTYAGALGAAFFAVALLAHTAAKRAELTEELARRRGVELNRLQQLSMHILQHLPSGVVVLDEAGRPLMLNPSASRLLSLDDAGDEPPELRSDLTEGYQAWRDQAGRSQLSLNRAGGSSVLARFARFDGAEASFDLIFLEDSALLNQRVQQGKLASLGRLTASIAHEIRNPLSAIQHASQLLAEAPGLSAEDARLTGIIVANAGRVNATIENVLSISRRAPSRRQSVELSGWLERFVAEFRELHHVPHGHLRVQPAAEKLACAVDPSQLKQILENLCGNALKYGHPERQAVSARLRRCGASFAPCVEVVDRGPGIPLGDVERLFEPFFTTSASGAGLGLYIARELAELNQATLTYEAAPQGGSCFRLCLQEAETKELEA